MKTAFLVTFRQKWQTTGRSTAHSVNNKNKIQVTKRSSSRNRKNA